MSQLPGLRWRQNHKHDRFYFPPLHWLFFLFGLCRAHAFPARRIHGGSLVDAEDRRAPGPAVPELLLDPGDLRHMPRPADNADLDDEVDALGRGDVDVPHRHLPDDAHPIGNAFAEWII